jgi:hypothetical protein
MTIQEWEYEYVDTFLGLPDAKPNLNLMGSQGWELVCVHKFAFFFVKYIFKRPKQ